MKAIDTNIIIYALDEGSPQHATASQLLKSLAEGTVPWAIPWPCLYEFLRVATHPAITPVRITMTQAWDRIKPILASPPLILLHETERHKEILESLIKSVALSGNLAFDAHVAALLMEHGVRTIITADHDFRRFQELSVENPFSG